MRKTQKKTEMLLFKGNDTTTHGNGNDRIRLRAAEITFDTYDSRLTDVSNEYANEDIKLSLSNELNISCNTNITQNLDVEGSTTLNNLTATGTTMLNTLAATGTTTLTTLNANEASISHLTSTGLTTDGLTAHTSAHLTDLYTTGRVWIGSGGMLITGTTAALKKLSYNQDVSIGLEVNNGMIWINGFSSLSWSGSVHKVDGIHTNQTGRNNVSFYAIGRTITGGNIVYSSKKLKNVESSLDVNDTMNEAITLFKSIPNSKYTYIDKDMHDGFTHFGLIAEDMPNEIYSTQSIGFAPNIYQIGIYENKIIKVNNPINLAKIENKTELQILYHQDNIVKELKITEFTFVDEYTISFENNIDVDADDNYFFVYGTLENIPSIEKECYFELTSCVVKNLLERIEKLESEITELKNK